jgi:hypothetical protein
MYRAEGSFADAANLHGYKRARWRGLMGMTIQNLLIAAAQNLRKLIRAGGPNPAMAAPALAGRSTRRQVNGSMAHRTLVIGLTLLARRILTSSTPDTTTIRVVPLWN